MTQHSSELTHQYVAPAFGCIADEDLVRRAQQGDQGALLKLVDRNYQRCFNLALRVMRNRHDAEDQVQSAFALALEHLNQFRYGAKFSSWLCRIVVNQCRMRFREMRRTRSTGTAADWDQSGTFEIRDAAPNPEDGLLERDLWGTVRREIHRLPRLYREVLVLRYLDHLSLTELADRLGVTVPTVKSRLFRGQLELRRRMVAGQLKRRDPR